MNGFPKSRSDKTWARGASKPHRWAREELEGYIECEIGGGVGGGRGLSKTLKFQGLRRSAPGAPRCQNKKTKNLERTTTSCKEMMSQGSSSCRTPSFLPPELPPSAGARPENFLPDQFPSFSQENPAQRCNIEPQIGNSDECKKARAISATPGFPIPVPGSCCGESSSQGWMLRNWRSPGRGAEASAQGSTHPGSQISGPLLRPFSHTHTDRILTTLQKLKKIILKAGPGRSSTTASGADPSRHRRHSAPKVSAANSKSERLPPKSHADWHMT